MASGFYDVFKQDLFVGDVDLDATDVIRVVLLDTNHDTDATALQTDVIWGDGTAGTVKENEISGTGYTSNGKALGTPTVVTATGTTTFDGDNVEWTGATFSCEHIVLYDFTNAESLMVTVDIGPQTVTAGTFTIQWNAAGIITMT